MFLSHIKTSLPSVNNQFSIKLQLRKLKKQALPLVTNIYHFYQKQEPNKNRGAVETAL